MERKKVENRIRELREMHNYTREGMVEMLCEGLRRKKLDLLKYRRNCFFKYKLPKGIFIIQETVWNRK